MTQQEFNNKFPNGFTAWHETHFEVVCHLFELSELPGSLAYEANEEGGSGRLYELAEELTDKFENAHIGVEWDGDFMDSIHAFLESMERGEI